jgi:hypothetical protein
MAVLKRTGYTFTSVSNLGRFNFTKTTLKFSQKPPFQDGFFICKIFQTPIPVSADLQSVPTI